MTMDSGRQVIVTGAAHGIGKVIAEQFADLGAHVWLIDMNKDAGEKLEKTLKKRGCQCTFVHTDVADPTQIKAFFDRIKTQHLSIHAIINNAGMSSFKPLDDLDVEEWDRVMNTNVRSVLLFSKLGSKFMNKGTSIVNIASTRASMSEAGSEAYAASKGAIISLTHALAASLSPNGITVNAISPGWIENQQYDQLREVDHNQHWSQRVGKPQDIARACLFLTDAENNFITGENLVIDGGMTRKMIYNH